MPTTHHPSLLDLELCRTGEASAEIAAHVRGCADCQATIQKLAELPEKLFVPTAPTGGFDPAREAAMFAFIRQRAAELRAQRRWRLPPGLKIAAGIIVAGTLATLAYVSLPKDSVLPHGMTGDDLNHDGQINILDALALAQQTSDDRSPEVCQLASRIVTLGNGGPQ